MCNTGPTEIYGNEHRCSRMVSSSCLFCSQDYWTEISTLYSKIQVCNGDLIKDFILVTCLYNMFMFLLLKMSGLFVQPIFMNFMIEKNVT
jgi:hypothetical protein